MTTELHIHDIPPEHLKKIAKGGKKRNKELLERLAGHNRCLTPPAAILSELGLDRDDIQFLDTLGRLSDGPHPYLFSPEPLAGDPKRLAALGLMYINGKKREISLADAGRFLLVLTLSQATGLP